MFGNAKMWAYYMYNIKSCPKRLILGPGLT